MSDSANERVPLRTGEGGFPESRELPRPTTPGPWHTEQGTVVVQADRGWIAQTMGWRVGDAEAIASLPEWIEDRDRWKARAERAEAALADLADARAAYMHERGTMRGLGVAVMHILDQYEAAE